MTLGTLNNLDTIRQAFSWLTRSGIGRRWPGMPIGWYQCHQMHAIDAINDAALACGIDPEQNNNARIWYNKIGHVFCKATGRSAVMLDTVGSLFHTADERARGIARLEKGIVNE